VTQSISDIAAAMRKSRRHSRLIEALYHFGETLTLRSNPRFEFILAANPASHPEAA
jgi:hypothetical protein